ncbi:serine/threonine protein kinase [Pseudomonas trivialis]|uniref:serine/threonine protein kinase n=2 Tax=Pseudomonas trivialis TaxID=200450 RepID=UPI0030CC5F18
MNEIGGWRLSKKLGSGGNGIVRLAQKGEQKGAMKILRYDSPKARNRFHDEVMSMRLCADIPGVLPVLESQVDPDEPGQKWFVMGLTKLLTDQLSDRSGLRTVVQAFAAYAETLAAMHQLKVSHRDIKPDNLFFYDGGWAVGDFGLATFQGKKAVTGGGRKIGPIYYLAPEMLNDPGNADERCADVFSLAKSLWVIATGQHYPLPGSYDLDHSAFRIGSYLSGERGVIELDRLIASATAFEPSRRPSMKLVGEELRAWLAPNVEISMPTNIDFKEHIAAIEQWQHSRARAAKSQKVRDEAIRSLTNRLSDYLNSPLSNLKNLIEKSLGITTTINKNPKCGFLELRVEVPADQDRLAFIILILDLNCESFPAVNLQGRIILEWRNKAGFINLIWKRCYEFIENGADEPIKIDTLRAEMTEATLKALSETLSLIIPSHKIEHKPKLVRIKVHDEKGDMLSGVSLRFIDSEGITLAAAKTANGIVEVALPTLKNVVIFVAHGSFNSTVVTLPDENLLVVLNGDPRSRSMICGGSWVSLAGLKGELAFVHDEIEGGIHRLYVHLKELSGNSGAPGAVDLSIGKPVRLKDNAGRVAYMTPRAVIGDNYLIDFEHAGDL